jgi:hypothetical protein
MEGETTSDTISEGGAPPLAVAGAVGQGLSPNAGHAVEMTAAMTSNARTLTRKVAPPHFPLGYAET